MKTFLLSSIFFVILGFSLSTFADVVTTTDVGIPITVTGDSYTVVTTPDYYYYTGHRCYVKERPDIGVNFLGLTAGVGGGTKIYCYPYP